VCLEHRATDHQDGDAALFNGVAHCDGQQPGELTDVADVFDIHAAFTEEFLRMGFLEVPGADFLGRDMGGDGQHWHTRTLGVEEPIDQVEVPWSGRSCGHRELSGYFGFSGCRKCARFLVADGHPFDGGIRQCISEPVEGVTGDPPDAFNAVGFECGHKVFCNVRHASSCNYADG